MADHYPGLSESDLAFLVDQNNSDRMIKKLLNSVNVIAKYRDLSVSRRSIICLSPQLRQIFDMLADDKSQYFVQPLSIIDKKKPLMPFLNFLEKLLNKHTSFLLSSVVLLCVLLVFVCFLYSKIVT